MLLSSISLALTRLGQRLGRWSPLALWPDGIATPGMWISPRDLASQWQDYTGTTPVATPGSVADSANPVGWALDIRAGAPGTLGPELVVNGDFATNVSNWNTNSCTLTWVAGDASATSSGGGFWQEFATVAGTTYKAVVPVASGTTQLIAFQGGGLSVTLASEGGAAGARVATIAFVAATSASRIYVKCNTNAVIDSISVKEIPGNHMLQSTSVDRPLLSARVNLLTYSQELDNGSWGLVGCTLSANNVTAPDGTLTAESYATNSGNGRIINSSALPANSIVSGVTYTLSIYCKNVSGSGQFFIYCGNGTTTTSSTFTATSAWQRFSFTFTANSTGNDVRVVQVPTAGDLISVWGAQLNLGSTALPYQPILTGSTYPSTDFPVAQLYDGVDDSMATAAFTAGTLIDGMDCLIAVRRDSAASFVTAYSSKASSSHFGACNSGASGSSNNASVGTPTMYVDGVQLAGGTLVTQGTVHTALTVGAWHILEIRNLDLSLWTGFGVGAWFSAWQFNGARGDIMLFPSTASTEDKDNAREYLAEYYGVTLP